MQCLEKGQRLAGLFLYYNGAYVVSIPWGLYGLDASRRYTNRTATTANIHPVATSSR
jgi:hypothetical protein